VPVAAYAFLREMYRRTARELQRIEAVRRSPIYGHVTESAAGGALVRAGGQESAYHGTNAGSASASRSPYMCTPP
jgi:hypothetical protein